MRCVFHISFFFFGGGGLVEWLWLPGFLGTALSELIRFPPDSEESESSFPTTRPQTLREGDKVGPSFQKHAFSRKDLANFIGRFGETHPVDGSEIRLAS